MLGVMTGGAFEGDEIAVFEVVRFIFFLELGF